MAKIPDFLVDMLEKQYGTEQTNAILKGYQTKRRTTLRANTLKSNIALVKQELEKINIEYKEVSWNKNALIITNVDEGDIQKLPIYENGGIYLQSLSSMLPPLILAPKEGENILDMTAAPGSKTTQIAAMTNNKAMITACELNKIRAERLKYNLEKQGVTCSYVMTTDARNLSDFFSFDKILLDAPCSGSGTIDKNDKLLEKNFTINLIQKSAKTQLALLKKALKLLKPGQEMVYSTCSILKSENEEILQKALKGVNAEIVPIKFEEVAQAPLLPVSIPGTVCVCPSELFEGFFIAKIKVIK